MTDAPPSGSAGANPAGDDLAFLREPRPNRAPQAGEADDATTRAGAARRRAVRRVGVATLALALAGTAAFATAALARHGRREPQVTLHLATTAPPTAPPILQRGVPPPAGAPFPHASTLHVAPREVLHHSGGPYVARRTVVAQVLDEIGCRIGTARRADLNVVCARVDVAFFDGYADAWKLRGAIWAFVPAWGSDREIYVLTVWGRVEQPAGGGVTEDSANIEITTVLVDATTGRTMMQGGPPLPESYANQ